MDTTDHQATRRSWVWRAMLVALLAAAFSTAAVMALWVWREYARAPKVVTTSTVNVWDHGGAIRYGLAMDGYSSWTLKYVVTTTMIDSPWRGKYSSYKRGERLVGGDRVWMGLVHVQSSWDRPPADPVKSHVRATQAEYIRWVDTLYADYGWRPDLLVDALVSGESSLRWAVNWRCLLKDFAVATLFLSSVIFAGWTAIRAAGRRRARLANRCLTCGYSLKGIVGDCPECGTQGENKLGS